MKSKVFESPARVALALAFALSGSAAGCAANQTPFNRDHTAGIQVLKTTHFQDGDGPFGR